MTPQPPLTEVQRLIKAFMDAKTSTKIDLKRVSQLVEVAQQEIIILKNKP